MSERYAETQYGFVWGAAEVERTASHKGYVVLTIRTPRQEVELTVTPSGLVRERQKRRRKKLRANS